jgi:hypothetical protein
MMRSLKMITTTNLLAHATEAETNAAAQDAEAATMLRAIERERSSLAYALADRKRAHRKATRLDRPNRHAQGRAELRVIDEERIPAIEARIAAAQADLDHLTADAARLRAVAADYRAQHAAATAAPVTVTTPYAFIDWYADYGTDKITDADADATLTAARTAYRTTAPRESVKITTADPRILDGLITAAAGFIASTREDIDNNPDMAGLLARDIRRTERFTDRIREALAGLLAQEPSNLTQWERETLTAAQEAPTPLPALTADYYQRHDGTTAQGTYAAQAVLNTLTEQAEQGHTARLDDDGTVHAHGMRFTPVHPAQGPQEAAHAPASVWVTTQGGERIEYAHIPNGDPARIAHFLDAARAVPTYRDASTEEAPAPAGESADPYPADNTMGRCNHGYTCRYDRPTDAPGHWVHPDREQTPCTVTPVVHVTWTDTLKGHHHATVTLPDGAHARITYAPKGTAYTHLGKASMGTGSPTVARARSLADLITQYARLQGYTAARIEEYGTPGRPARV